MLARFATGLQYCHLRVAKPTNTMIQTTSYVDGLVDFMLIESEDTPEFTAEAMYQQIDCRGGHSNNRPQNDELHHPRM